MGDDKPEIVLEPKVLWTLSFCIALCSLEFLLDLVVLRDLGLALVLEKDEVCSKFLCSKMKRLLRKIKMLQRLCYDSLHLIEVTVLLSCFVLR